MSDYEALTASIIAKVDELIESCRNGLFLDQNGAKARFATDRDARRVVKEAIEKYFEGDMRRVFDYILASPDVLDEYLGAGTVGSVIKQAVVNRSMYVIMSEVETMIIDQRPGATLETLLADIRKTVDVCSSYCKDHHADALIAVLLECEREADAKALTKLAHAIGSEAMLLSPSIEAHKATMPNFSQLLALAHRRLREAQNHIQLIVHHDKVADFCGKIYSPAEANLA